MGRSKWSGAAHMYQAAHVPPTLVALVSSYLSCTAPLPAAPPCFDWREEQSTWLEGRLEAAAQVLLD